MKSILRIYSWFLILLSLSYLGQVHTTQNNQQGWWHEPLVELYFKGTSKISRKETKDMIQVFEELHNRHIKSMQDIYNKIEPKMLNKSKFSSNKYELDVLTVFYLFKKIDSSKGLLQEEVQQGYQALTKLYYKGTRKKQESKRPIEEILTQTTIRKNKKPTKYEGYALDLAQYLDNHSISPDQEHEPLPIRVQKAPRYSNHHNNLTTQLHGLKTTLSTSTSMLALSQIDSLDRVPSLEVHTSDEEESEEDTKEEYSTNTSFSTTRNNNHEMHLEQVIKEKNAHENRLKKLKKLDKQLTKHLINKHNQSLGYFDTNPESQTLGPFTKQPNTLGNHPSQHNQTRILSLDDIHNGVLNEVHQKHKASLNQIKEVKQQLEDKQQIIESMQKKADQDKATIQNLKDEMKGLQRKAKAPTTNPPNSPNIITHVLALVAGIMVGIAIDKYVSKAKYEEKGEQSVSDKKDSSV